MRKLVTSKDIAPSTVRLQPGSFQRPNSYTNTRTQVRERRMLVTFGAAGEPTLVYHGLGFIPSGFTELGKSGGIISNDFPLVATSRVIVLKCDTANTVADILVR